VNNEITDTLLQVVAGDVEKLLIENREQIDFSYKNHGTEGVKLSMGISLDPSSSGVCVNYDIGFDLEPKPEPPEKCKIKLKHNIAENQPDLDI
jgi:hypothetical protein